MRHLYPLIFNGLTSLPPINARVAGAVFGIASTFIATMDSRRPETYQGTFESIDGLIDALGQTVEIEHLVDIANRVAGSVVPVAGKMSATVVIGYQHLVKRLHDKVASLDDRRTNQMPAMPRAREALARRISELNQSPPMSETLRRTGNGHLAASSSDTGRNMQRMADESEAQQPEVAGEGGVIGEWSDRAGEDQSLMAPNFG